MTHWPQITAGLFHVALLLCAMAAPAASDPASLQLASVRLPQSYPALELQAEPQAEPQAVLFGLGKRRRGALCGDRAIEGERAGAVTGHLQGCGAAETVRVTSVAGVALSQPSILTCDTARALRKWVEDDVVKAFGRRNQVVRLRVAAHYACRTRNNRPGARVSEHGRAKAIDISGFYLEDGALVTVLKGWRDRSTRRALRKMWRGACGPFGTVLGPDSDRYHQDHFHFDTARHRGGAYCR